MFPDMCEVVTSEPLTQLHCGIFEKLQKREVAYLSSDSVLTSLEHMPNK